MMMAVVDQAQLAVRTLARVDPEFQQLVATLYGDDALEEIAKISPDQSDVNTHGSSTSRRLAFAGTLAGGVLGAKELGNELPELAGPVGRGAKRVMGTIDAGGKKLVPVGSPVRRALAAPQGRVAVAGTALGADALATRELNPNKPQQVNKLELPSVGDMASGIRQKLTGVAGKLVPLGADGKPTPATGTVPLPKDAPVGGAGAPGGQQVPPGTNPKVMSNWSQFGQGAAMAGSSAPGKVLIGSGLIASALKARQLRQNGQQQVDPSQQYYDPSQQVGKGREIVWEGEISKVDNDKQLVFGWANVVEIGGVPVVDAQADVITPDDLEDAAYQYVLTSRVGGHMHKRVGKGLEVDLDEPHHVSDMVESMVFTRDKIEALGLPDNFPIGWWAGYKIHDPEVWEDVKKGRLTSFSIHGRGKRAEIPIDTVMGW